MQQGLSVYTCSDGTKTIYNKFLDETYHSRNGAIPESLHVFIKEGFLYSLNQQPKNEITIFEMGFGSGLNAILTYIESQKFTHLKINYITVETNPISFELVSELQFINYDSNYYKIYKQMHDSEFNKLIEISENFKLLKLNKSLIDLDFNKLPLFDIVYFDAFAPDKQPELWTLENMQKIFSQCHSGAVFTTYSSKGEVKRNLIKAGFNVERLKGPPKKRHMLRATKI
ncbi:MAG: tRNA (5-methylaminomethyl-2-thiouridine)(34)-methyltransferase MnmD [Bacteroidia bacterium]